MSVESSTAAEPAAGTPQERVSTRLFEGSKLRLAGKLNEASAELLQGLTYAKETPFEIEFQTRIQLAMTFADVCQASGEIEKARDVLAEEVAFADKVSQIMQATGTPAQKRGAMSGYLQVKDRATQISLIGQQAPEISVKKWIREGPSSLADLKDRVVLLEFWATWCKPCQEMFPKLQKLYETEADNGLETIALTRHYLAYRGTEEAMADELGLMRRMVDDHGITFAVGVAPDEQLQGIYGANGLPTVALIDRNSTVRYAGPGADDPLFNKTLRLCLDE